MRGGGSRGWGRRRFDPCQPRLSAGDREPARRGADADRAARLAAQGAAGPADAAGADRGRDHRPDGLRLSRRRAARLRPPRPRAARRRCPRRRRCRSCSAKGYLAITFDQPVAEGALPGHRPAGGQEPGARRRRAISRSRSRSRAWSGSRPKSAAGIGPPAGCCFSICPRARRGASGCTRGSTIPTGRTSRSSADR